MISNYALLAAVIIWSWLEYAWNTYLIYRQWKVVKSSKSVPSYLTEIISADSFTKARCYKLDNIRFGIISSLYENILGTLTMVFFILPLVWGLSKRTALTIGSTDNEVFVSIIFSLIFQTISLVASLPVSIYRTFVIEEKYGFNKQTPWFFVKDTLKSYALMAVMLVISTGPIVYIVKAGGKYFFFYLWLFSTTLSLFFMFIYPDFIAPLFDTYTPLNEGPLRTKIEDLASSLDFPLKKLYVVQGSKRSAHSNAYFYGFYKNKRIVLFDTLLKDYKFPDQNDTVFDEESTTDAGFTDLKTTNATNTESESQTQTAPSDSESCDNLKAEKSDVSKGCTDDEIVAVLAHELGHWKYNHVFKSMVISLVNLFLLFVVFSFLFNYEVVYTAFGFNNDRPVVIGLLVVLQFLLAPYHLITNLAVTMLGRTYEFEADRFAIDLGKGDLLRSSLIKLNQDNLGFPIYDWLYSLFNLSHPPLLERLQAISKTE